MVATCQSLGSSLVYRLPRPSLLLPRTWALLDMWFRQGSWLRWILLVWQVLRDPWSSKTMGSKLPNLMANNSSVWGDSLPLLLHHEVGYVFAAKLIKSALNGKKSYLCPVCHLNQYYRPSFGKLHNTLFKHYAFFKRVTDYPMIPAVFWASCPSSFLRSL